MERKFDASLARDASYLIPHVIRRHFPGVKSDGGHNLFDGVNQWVGGRAETTIVEGHLTLGVDLRADEGSIATLTLSPALQALLQGQTDTLVFRVAATDMPLDTKWDDMKEAVATKAVEAAIEAIRDILTAAKATLGARIPNAETVNLLSALAPRFRERFEIRTASHVSPPDAWRFVGDSRHWVGDVPPADGDLVYVIDHRNATIALAQVKFCPGYSREPVDYYDLVSLGGRPDIDYLGVLSIPEKSTGSVGSGTIVPRTPMVDVVVRLAVNALGLYNREQDRREAIERAFAGILKPIVDQALPPKDGAQK